ncbi:bifunctional hydroxymethylpyrimidine kinase/phosphomethylpyrimidine kinase [Candidatus Fonsibacter ubiquis]|uniref:bifunctional hydroxymethylpyrimidine kinase/phosphomethylpyrimidine kinase n=1 Tax=Candidatus Fonsibacter ubiquis TaxID=1925548 RepID=UPI000C089069|nr:bifunctional hydroxymethylpyrimidine kinase/phosphomethylpyrimidine kinase [Candidatus Fonsibacter ubiquis]
MKLKSKLLIIAGSDSSGGAGIQADIKTATALGVYAMTAITAITAQNTTGVKSIVSIPPREIFKQISFSVQDIKPSSVKIGMLHNVCVIKEVIKAIKKHKLKNIVIDPVMVAKGGQRLISNSSINFLREKLFPYALLVTPNIPEAEALINKKIKTLDDIIKAGKQILKFGPKFVLIKGGHINKSIIEDVLISKNNIKIFKNKKIKTKNTHGTGCTLSSAIASFISRNYNMNESCRRSIQYVHKAILLNPKFGRGHGPINHMALLN